MPRTRRANRGLLLYRPRIDLPLYRDGTIGYAKEHLHATAETINLQLAELGGHAWVSVCKALVTKASAYIPVLPVYLGLLMGVMKERGVHEGCIEQMQRLFATKMYGPQGVVADGNRLIRMDDHELDPAIQAAVSALWSKVTPDNFHGLGILPGCARTSCSSMASSCRVSTTAHRWIWPR